MKYLVVLLFLFTACKPEKKVALEINNPNIQGVLDSIKVKGSVLFYDLEKDEYQSNNFDWAKEPRSPASTFKIANTLVGLETGAITDSVVFKWDGKKRSINNWNQDLNLRDAFQFSCVPCYQELARTIGVDTMNASLKKIGYPFHKADSSNLDSFWLTGEAKITMYEQIEFLIKLYKEELPISPKNRNTLLSILKINNEENYDLYAKTGWSTVDFKDNGWLVGFIKKGEKTYFFATNIEPKKDFNRKLFSKIRVETTLKAFEKLNLTYSTSP